MAPTKISNQIEEVFMKVYEVALVRKIFYDKPYSFTIKGHNLINKLEQNAPNHKQIKMKSKMQDREQWFKHFWQTCNVQNQGLSKQVHDSSSEANFKPNEFRLSKTEGNPHGTLYSWLAKTNFI